MEDEEQQWALWMQAAAEGDQRSYRRLLDALVPLITAVARTCLARNGRDLSELDDVVQESLLAIHLKRHLWDASRPLVPWVRALVVNKTIDSMRRRGRRIVVPIEPLANMLPADTPQPDMGRSDIERLIGHVRGRQRLVLEAIALKGQTVREAADSLGMSEGAARVTLHRAIKAIAELVRKART
ncbi:MAG: sigma-70 family RNA polymerase sigma factor [Hyphomicrobiaceae bacterium]|nr:sigma-70 family RNA polymerase sigma factor [Hyphomicrobiaceae bacterium]